MTADRREALLDRDWADAWEQLPEAPPLVSRPKAAQITLRLPERLLGRLRAVGAAKALPYHALARSWIIEALREPVRPAPRSIPDEPQAAQLNLKLDSDVLEQLKVRADAQRRPYHALAREWIDAALRREEEARGSDPAPARRPALKELMVLLLHATNQRGQDAVRGMTRLQKLLFVIEQQLGPPPYGFYPHHYGPFNENVNDAVRALQLAGFLSRGEAVTAEPPSFEEMMATVARHAGPRAEPEVEDFALSERGHGEAEELRRSSRAYDQLFARIREIRAEWDTEDLIERVYDTWPAYTERSLIRDQVAQRRSRRRSQ